jgi:hypothetical protein
MSAVSADAPELAWCRLRDGSCMANLKVASGYRLAYVFPPAVTGCLPGRAAPGQWCWDLTTVDAHLSGASATESEAKLAAGEAAHKHGLLPMRRSA